MTMQWQVSAMQLPGAVLEVCRCVGPDESSTNVHEIVPLGDGRIAVAVGEAPELDGEAVEDLCAHVRVALQKSPGPAAVLAELDTAMVRPASLVCALLDPVALVIRVANAAHPPPVVIEGVTVTLLDDAVGPALGAPGTLRHEAVRGLQPETALFLWTNGLLGDSTEERAQLDQLLHAARGIHGGNAWASEFARRATESCGRPARRTAVVSVRMAVSAPSISHAPDGIGDTPVSLRVYLDPADPRTRHLLRLLSRLDDVVHGFGFDVDVIDVVSTPASAEAAGVLAAPTVVRVSPGPAVRAVGWFDTAVDLARALQLPLT